MLCILQCRMSSQRLPGKMLMDLKGRPLLGRVIDRILLAEKVTKLVVATSTDDSDNDIEVFCKKENISCHRGSLNDVAGRFLTVAIKENAPAFIRINGDSPLMDASVIDHAVLLFEAGPADLVTNVCPRTFPKGQSVELISTATFATLYQSMTTDIQREHVTKAFYETPEQYRMVSFTSGGSYNHINMCVDTKEDKTNIEKILTKCDNEPGNWYSLCALFGI